MDATTLQKKVYFGYYQAALRLGTSYDQYRPTTANNPLAAGNKVGSILMSPSYDGSYAKSGQYGKPFWQALMDGTTTQEGDYLLGVNGPYFISSQRPLSPILVIQCNTVANFLARPEPGAGPAAGQAVFGGEFKSSRPEAQTLAANWPISLLQGVKGESPPGKLPDAVRSPWWLISLPVIPGLNIGLGMRFTVGTVPDDRWFTISSAEKTYLGWRLQAREDEV